jgi:hypothetical protein
METKELLLHLTKKLESKDLGLFVGRGSDGLLNIYLWDDKNGGRIKLAELPSDLSFLENDADVEKGCERFKKLKLGEGEIRYGMPFKYKEEWNDEFKEKFYKYKGIKCWVKDCPNKVCVEKGDHEKLRLQCLDEKHTRIVCKPCSETDYIHQLEDGVF